MPSLEAVCGRLFGNPGWMPKALWGGALCFIPILNLFSLGYLLEYVQRPPVQPVGSARMAEMEIPNLFIGGIRMLLLLACLCRGPPARGLVAQPHPRWPFFRDAWGGRLFPARPGRVRGPLSLSRFGTGLLRGRPVCGQLANSGNSPALPGTTGLNSPFRWSLSGESLLAPSPLRAFFLPWGLGAPCLFHRLAIHPLIR